MGIAGKFKGKRIGPILDLPSVNIPAFAVFSFPVKTRERPSLTGIPAASWQQAPDGDAACDPLDGQLRWSVSEYPSPLGRFPRTTMASPNTEMVYNG